MTKRLLDYDPLTGTRTWFEYEQSTDRMLITDEQDVQLILDQTAAARSDTDYSRQGIKDDMWHYARIPNVVMVEMKEKHGVDMFGSNVDWKSVFKIINREYPWLKTTDKHHA